MNAAERMIAERNFKFRVSMEALRMLQEHYGNKYFSFACVSDREGAEWMAKAEKALSN